MSDSVRLIAMSERRFGRLQAYECVTHWASMAWMLVGTALLPTPVPGWASLLAYGVSAATRVVWCRVMDAETYQQALVIGNKWEELERLVSE